MGARTPNLGAEGERRSAGADSGDDLAWRGRSQIFERQELSPCPHHSEEPDRRRRGPAAAAAYLQRNKPHQARKEIRDTTQDRHVLWTLIRRSHVATTRRSIASIATTDPSEPRGPAERSAFRGVKQPGVAESDPRPIEIP